MKIEVVTLFPRMIAGTLEFGVIGRAIARGLLRVGTEDPRAHTSDVHRTVDDRGNAAALTGAVIEIERAVLPRLAEREYYRTDLVGLRVHNLDGADLGIVSHFVEAPGGAVMVTREAGGREHWLSAAPPHLQRVDLAAREILVDWPAELE